MSVRQHERAGAGVLEAAALAAEHLDLLVLGAARDVHSSVSGRVHSVLDRVLGGPTIPHRMHDGISTGVYAGIGYGLRASARALRAVDSLGVGPDIEDTARGRFVVSAVNGLIGDKLAADGSALAIEAGIRRDGRDVPLTRDGLGAAYPEASEAIVVFLHGLCETEDYWLRRSRPRLEDGGTTPSYGARLEADEG